MVACEGEQAVGDPEPLCARLGPQDRSHLVVHDLDVARIKRALEIWHNERVSNGSCYHGTGPRQPVSWLI